MPGISSLPCPIFLSYSFYLTIILSFLYPYLSNSRRKFRHIPHLSNSTLCFHRVWQALAIKYSNLLKYDALLFSEYLPTCQSCVPLLPSQSKDFKNTYPTIQCYKSLTTPLWKSQVFTWLLCTHTWWVW
jgi:hypothetical protein